MTKLPDPSSCRVFIVGQNQAKTYSVERITWQRYLDAHFNRNGQTCRSLYNEMTGGKASPTRKSTDKLADELDFAGVVETNVVCYSTKSAASLRAAVHVPGAKQGAAIFLALLNEIRPRLLMLHGKGTLDLARKHLRGLPPLVVPTQAEEIRAVPAVLEAHEEPF